MMGKPIIRRAEKADLAGILEIFNYNLINTTAIYEYEPYSLEKLTNWYLKKQENDFPLFVAELSGKILGYVTYSEFRWRPAYKYAVEHSIYVHQDFHKQGIARQLMNQIIETAKAQGKHTLIGGIDAENKGSIAFHEKFGFKTVAHLKEVGFKFDRWLDLVFMQLVLQTPENPKEG